MLGGHCFGHVTYLVISYWLSVGDGIWINLAGTLSATITCLIREIMRREKKRSKGEGRGRDV